MSTETQKKILAPSWEQMGFMALVRVVAMPMLLPFVVIAGLYVWYVKAGEPIPSIWYSILLFVAYLVSFFAVALFLSKRYVLTRDLMALVMGFCGLVSGLLIAGVKIGIYFEPWTIFRLLSEPIFTALFAGILGAIVLWGKSRLPSHSEKGIL